MSVKLVEFKTYTGTERGGIGANSVDTSAEDAFVTISGNVVAKSTAGDEIAGVSLTRKVYASDNQTVAMAALDYIPVDVDNVYAVTITGGTITAADEGKFFDLSDAVTVDGTSESTTTGQLRMVKFVSATNSNFKIANM